jgi:hypothetical protein
MSKPSYQELLDLSIKLAMKLCERNTEIARLREENAKLLEENDRTVAEIMHKSQIDWVEEYLVDQYANAMEERCQ